MSRSLHVVKHLVAGHAAGPGDGFGLVEVVIVEIAHPPRADFAGLLQGREGGDGLDERMRAAPVQEVAVEPIGGEPRQRALAGGDGAGARGVVRQHLGDEKHLVAAAGDGFADDALGGAVAVHLGGVDVVHAEIEAAAQRRDGGAPVAVFDVPGALADHRHVAAGRSEPVVPHGRSAPISRYGHRLRRWRRGHRSPISPRRCAPGAPISCLPRCAAACWCFRATCR